MFSPPLHTAAYRRAPHPRLTTKPTTAATPADLACDRNCVSGRKAETTSSQHCENMEKEKLLHPHRRLASSCGCSRDKHHQVVLITLYIPFPK